MRHRPPQGSSPSSSSTSKSSLLSISLSLLSLLPSTIAADSVPQIPPIDFDALGALGVSGSFAGLQLWSPEVSSNNQSTILQPSSSTLLSRLPNGTLSRIGSTEEDGQINSICQLNSPNNSGRRVFVGGKFDKIIGKGVSNVFSYDPGNQSFDDLLGGLDGQVDALYCDSEKNSIIFGGSFKNPVNPGDDSLINSRYLGSVAGWNETSKTWFPLQFGGLNGSISFISSGTNSSNLRFGGAFDVEYAALPGTNPNNQLNASSVSGTNTSSSALTSALTPLSLGQSEFTGGPPLNLMGFDDPAQILCPQGEDGPDNSYLFADRSVGRLTVRTFRPLDVRAIRLGNTFYQGRGTKTFGLVSIPDNTPLELTYLDPITDRNMTCTNNCTLTNETSIPYQDFLISQTESNGAVNGTKVLTGIEFTAYDYYGQGAGLHILELLSEGAWSYAYGGYNRGSCSSPQLGVNGTASNSTSEGGWYHSAVTVNNAVGGTIEAVMSLTDDYTNLQSNVGSSLTWNVDVPVDGNYSVYMFVPGCQALNECGMRTSVDVITRSNSSSPGNTTRISQVVQQDTSIMVYDGEIIKTSSNFTPSITLSIPADMPAPADGNRFTIIADKISLLLRNSNETFQGVKARGFGVFEFDEFDPLSQININGTLNATGTLPNITISDLSRFSVALLNNGVRGNESEKIWAIQDCANQTFVGGNFTSDAYNATAFNGSTGTNVLPATAFANLVYYNATTAGNVSILPGGGLNSAVYALTSVADLLYIGGNFTSTLDNGTILNYFAIYDPVKLEWTPILDGPTGPVRSLVPLPDGSILVSGDFDTIYENGQVGGYGVFDPVKKTWLNQPELLVASINAASAPAPNGDANAESWLAGKVVALSKSKTSGGGAGLSQNDDTKMLEINGLNFAFKGSLADGTTPKENNSMTGLIGTFRRDSNPLGRQVEEKVSSFGNWFSRAKSALPPISPDNNSRSSNSNKLSAQRSIDEVLIKRQGSSSSISALLPESLQSDGSNELLATAYWAKPGVNDVSAYPRIVGGNFTTTNGIKNIGYYDPTADGNAGALTALPVFPNEQGMNVTLVRSLLIVGNILYVGGDGGLVTMDLSATPLMWRTGSDSPAVLETDDDEENGQVQVISMVHRPDTDTIVVAGKFSSAGNLPCEGTCAWDQGLMRWASLRNGVQGQVEALDYANRDASLLIAAGSLSLNGVRTSLAGYDFIKQIWTPFGSVGSGNGQIPGPATAVSVDDLNADAIFVAGRTSDGSAPFLVKWDGTSYQPVGGNELQSESGISQLTFFPISQAHPSNNVIEQNRVLVVSGALLTNSFGNLSSALFDGESWIPFLMSTSNNGMNGIIRGLQRSTEVIRYPNLHRLAVGIVILISIALGLGVVFLLVLIGLVWALARRRSEPQPVVAASHPSQDTLTDGEDMAAVGGLAGAGGAKKRPSSLLATLNAATENVVSMSHPSGGTEGSGMVSYGAPVAGGAAAAAALNQHNRNESMGQPTTLDHSDETAQTGRTGDYYSGAEDGNYEDAYDQDAAGLATAAAVGDHSRGIPAHARYSFEATHESELGVRAGQSLEILDDGDEHWWLIMDENGRRGVVPATYIL